MNHTKLGCCYFPTTVAFIDDNQSFLDSIAMGLDPRFTHKMFTKINQFEHYLQTQHSPLKNEEWATLTDNIIEHDTHDQHELAINFDLIYKQIFNLNRYQEISVVVVDYAMPERDGVAVCQSIRKHNPNIKTLLLTGEADHQIAVDAFNNKLIDKFILKENIDTLTNKVNAAIIELAQDYFYQVLEGLNSNLIANNQILSQKTYLELFQSVYDQHQACEYYLIDPSGGYLMLNANGDAKWLILRNSEDIRVYTELSRNEEYLSDSAREQIEQRQVIPFYHGEYLNLPQQQWHEHLLPAKVLTATAADCLYAINDGWANSKIDKDLVQPFKLFEG